MDVEVTPEPNEDERAAITAAIEAYQAPGERETGWWAADLPDGSAEDDDL